ncbi:MAG: class I SAM-dependent methyltransferase [Nitrososphaerota archaeon]
MNILNYMMGKWVYGHSLPIQALEKMRIQPGDTLCIIGCGYGDTAIHAARRFGSRVHAYDIHPQLVEKTRVRVSSVEWVRVAYINPYEDVCQAGGHCLIEVVLSYLRSPGDFLCRMADLHRFVGVVEITAEGYLDGEHYFGGGVRLRSDFEWREIFNSLGLEILWDGGHNLSLMRKFWEDLRIKPLTTFHDMAKTTSTSWRRAEARDAIKRFRQLFSEYGDLLKCKYYIVRRCV